MSDDRSERLRQRRKRSKGKAQDSERSDSDKPSKLDKTSESEKPSKLSKLDETDGSDKQNESVKEEQVGTYMYLPKSQKKDLERVYNILKAEYEYEYDEEFEKNRSFYPLVVEHGLDSLDGLDASEVKERLDGL